MLRDDLGRSIVAQVPAQRIVTLSPAATELLFAVGCGPALVLRDNWSDYPPAAKAVPRIDGMQPSPEAILAVRPDLVLANYPTPGLQAALTGAGVAWAALSPDDTAGVARSLRLVGALCGHRQQAETAAQDFEADLQALAQATERQPKVRVFYEMDAGDGIRPYTVGKRSFASGLVQVAGGINVFADRDEAWFQVSIESIMAADPDLIVLADSDVPERPQSPASLAQRPGFSQLRAVRQGRIATIGADYVSRPGPRLLSGAARMTQLLHPSVALPPRLQALLPQAVP